MLRNKSAYLLKQKKIVKGVLVNTGPGSDGVTVDLVLPPFNIAAGASECDILFGVTTVVPLPIPLHRKTTTLHTCYNWT